MPSLGHGHKSMQEMLSRVDEETGSPLMPSPATGGRTSRHRRSQAPPSSPTTAKAAEQTSGRTIQRIHLRHRTGSSHPRYSEAAHRADRSADRSADRTAGNSNSLM